MFILLLLHIAYRETVLVNEFGSITARNLKINSGLFYNNGGLIQSLNDLSINTNNQDLFNLDSGDYGIISGGNLTLKTGNLFNDFGYIRSQGATTANINGSFINNQGLFASDSILNLRANNISGNKDGLIASVNDFASITTTGLLNNEGGTIQSATSLNIKSGELNNTNGILNSGIIDVNSGTNKLTNDGGSINGNTVNLDSGILSNNGGLIQSINSLAINTNNQDLFNNNSGDNGIISGGSLNLTTGNIFNSSGYIRSQGELNATLNGSLLNNQGIFASNSVLNLRAKSISGNQDGLIASVNDSANITLDGLLHNQGGTIQSAINLKINSGELNNTNGILNSTTVDINAGTNKLTNDNGSISGTDVNLNSGFLSNNSGLIQSSNTLNLNTNGQDVINTNSGNNGIISGGLLNLNVGNLNNTFGYIRGQNSITANINGSFINDSGIFASDSVLNIKANSIGGNNGGIIASVNDSATIFTNGLLNNSGGSINSVTSLDINSGELKNDGGNIDAKTVSIETNFGKLANDGGSITGNDVNLNSGFLSNNAGLIQGLNSLNINTNNQDLINTNSGSNGILSGGNLNIFFVGNINNTSGYIRSQGAINANINNDLLNNNGVFASDGMMTINADTISGNNGGTIASTNDFVSITTKGLLNNSYGLISSGKTVFLHTPLLDNTHGTIFSAVIDLDLGTNSFSNDGGSLIGREITIKSGTFSNNGGLIQATNSLNINTNGFSLFNKNSGDNGLVSGGTLNIFAGDLFNTNGYIRSQGTATVNSTGALNNDGGVLASNEALNVTANSISGNNSGVIASVNDLANIITNGLLNNSVGTIQSATSLNIKSGELNNTNGTLNSNLIDINAGLNKLTNDNGNIIGNEVNLNSGILSNNGGLIQSLGTLAINTNNRDLINTNSGNSGIISGGNLNIFAGNLNNTAGYLRSQGTLSATLNGELLNNQGIFAGNGALTLTANSISRNNGGVIASVNDFATFSINGLLHNAGGTIQSATNLTINSKELNNSGGSLSANIVNLDTANNRLTNDNGSIFGREATIKSGILSNDGGLLQGLDSLNINTNNQELINTNSGNNGILSGGELNIFFVGNLNNSNGYIGSKGLLTINAANITNNNNGFITGQSGFNLTAAGLNNNGGNIIFQSSIFTNVGNGTVSNNNGLISSGGTTAIFAGTIINTNTNTDGKGIEGADVSLVTSFLNNKSGAIRADNLLEITASNSVDNTDGLITSIGDVVIKDPNSPKNLAVINTNGKIVSGNNTTIDAKSLTADGKVSANNDLTIKIDDDYTNDGTIEAGNNLTFLTKGNLINNGKFAAGFRNSITAQNIFNNSTGEFSGTITNLNATDSIINRGLIDGIQTILTSGNLINNIGTGRIYGDYLALGTNTLNNLDETINGETKSGTIAARQFLDIGAVNVNNINDSYIFSAGDLSIGRTLDSDYFATGKADAITNASAKIEALGNISFAAENIRNLNTQLTYGETSSGISKRTISFSNRTSPGHTCPNETGVGCNLLLIFPDEYDPSLFQIRPPSPGDDPRETYVFGKLPGNAYNSNLGRIYIENNYLETTVETTVFSSKPAEIIAGSNIFFDGNVFNQDSRIIAGGTITQVNGSLTNQSAQGTRTVTRNGSFTYHDWWHSGGFKSGNETGVYFKVLPPTTFELSTTTVQQNTNATSGTTIAGATTNTISETAGGSNGGNASVNTNNTTTNNVSDAGLNQKQKENIRSVNISESEAIKPFAAQQTEQQAVTAAELNTVNTDPVKAAETKTVDQTGVKSVETTDTDQTTVKAAETNQTEVTNAALIKAGTVDTKIPNSSIFSINPNSSSYLIETDPRFTNYRDWLSSDYMLTALNYDPNIVTKRLGDGFYEQKLIREQIAQLTGRPYLEGQSNDDDQYKALMSAAVTFASEFDLRPGIALTNEQLARLTSDIVWLVEEEVTLPNGTKTKALVPKVYVVPRETDVEANGALISGDRINLNLTGDLNNSGTIAGRTVTQITAENLNNLGGRITGNQLDLNVRKDINNIGGTIDAQKSAAIKAGGDINVTTTTGSSPNGTAIDRLAGIYVGDGSMDPTTISLLLEAGRNVNVTGGVIGNNGAGSTVVKAGDNINLKTVETKDINERTSAGKKSSGTETGTKTQENGSNINVVGDVKLQAGKDIDIRSSVVNSQTGDVTLKADRDVNITSGQATDSSTVNSQSKDKGFLSTTKTKEESETKSTTQLGSEITGNKVNIDAGRDVTVKSSSVVSDNGTNINAGKNVTITDSQNTTESTSKTETKKSGIMSGGGASIFIGNKTNSTETKTSTSESAGSQVGSLNGDVNIKAGEKYEQKGSDVTAVTGDVNITAKSVDITAGQNTSTSETTTKTKQTGVTLSVSSPIADTAQATVNAAKQAGQSDNARVNAMAGANAAYDAYKTVDQVKKLDETIKNGGTLGSISATVGSSKSETTEKTSSTEAVSSNVNAGGNVNITATGGGKDSNVNVTGSNINGDKSVTIKADNDINITSAQDKTKEETSNKSSGWSAGVELSISATKPPGVSVTGNVNSASGNSKGESTTQVNSTVSSNGTTTLQSGGTTTIAGGQVKGNKVEVDAKELKIESVQDTATYDSKQKSVSVGGSVNVTGAGGSVNGSVNKSNVTADHASVNQQSGIIAGDGGYKVNVTNNTDLKGGIITSTQPAEDAGKNSVTTGTLTSSDVNNKSEYNGSAIGVNGNVGINKPKDPSKSASTGPGINAGGSNGFGSDKDKQTSTTNSGINTSNLTITDAEKQAATGKTIDEIRSEVKTDTTSDKVDENSGALENIFDKDKVQKELDLQVAVTQEFSKNSQEVRVLINQKSEEKRKAAEALEAEAAALREQAGKFTSLSDLGKIGSLNRQADALEAQAKELSDSANKWQTGGIIFDSITGALSAGNVGGTIAQGAAPFLAKEIGDYFKKKDAEGKDGQGTPAHLLAHAVLGAAVAAAGGDNPFASGVSAAVAEGAAPYLAKWLYGTDKPEDLTAEQKSTITSIVSMIGTGIGGAIGDASDAIAGGNAAQNAVDNNVWIIVGGNKYVYRKGKCSEVAKKGETCVEDGYRKEVGGAFLEFLEGNIIRYDGKDYPPAHYAYCNKSEGCVIEEPVSFKTEEDLKRELNEKIKFCSQAGCDPYSIKDDYYNILKTLSPETLAFLKTLPPGDKTGDPLKALEDALALKRQIDEQRAIEKLFPSLMSPSYNFGNPDFVAGGRDQIDRITKDFFGGIYQTGKNGLQSVYNIGPFVKNTALDFVDPTQYMDPRRWYINGVYNFFTGSKSGFFNTSYDTNNFLNNIPTTPRFEYTKFGWDYEFQSNFFNKPVPGVNVPMGQLTTMVAGELTPGIVFGIVRPVGINSIGSLGGLPNEFNPNLFNPTGPQRLSFIGADDAKLAPYNPSGSNINCAACVSGVVKSRVNKGFFTATDIESSFPIKVGDLPDALATRKYIEKATGVELEAVNNGLNAGAGHYVIVREPTFTQQGHVVYGYVTSDGRRYILDPQKNLRYWIQVGKEPSNDVKKLLGNNPKIYKVVE